MRFALFSFWDKNILLKTWRRADLKKDLESGFSGVKAKLGAFFFGEFSGFYRFPARKPVKQKSEVV